MFRRGKKENLNTWNNFFKSTIENLNLLKVNGPPKLMESLNWISIAIRKYTKHPRIIKTKETFLPGSKFETVIHDDVLIATELKL